MHYRIYNQSDCTVSKVLVLNVANLGLIPAPQTSGSDP